MAIPEGSNKTIIGIITASVLAVGAGAAVVTGVVPNPFQTAKQTESTSPAAAKAKTAKTAPVVCRECGTVESIESFTEKGQATGGGAIAGGVIGGIVGHQIGKGRGKDLATVAGAVGGAIAGHEIEKAEVRLPGGPIRTVGEHVITLHLHSDVDVEVPLTVNAEE